MRKSKYLMERITQRAAGGGSAADQPEGNGLPRASRIFSGFFENV